MYTMRVLFASRLLPAGSFPMCGDQPTFARVDEKLVGRERTLQSTEQSNSRHIVALVVINWFVLVLQTEARKANL